LFAGGLAYRFFFWLVSLGAVGGAISSFWAATDETDLESTAKSFGLTATAAATFRDAVDFGSTPRWVFLVGGSILTVWFGMSATRALCLVFALAWGLPVPKIRRRVRAALLFTAVAVVYLAPRLGREGGVYGAFGTSTAILLWLYVGAMLFTAAAFVNSTLWERRRLSP
jgi:uncharacterized BrkB/YihY/UPF0761 family membrane protein